MEKILLVAVGIPGCGKSTWWEAAKEIKAIPKNRIRINMDTIRKDLTGSENDQTRNSEVAAIAKMNLEAALSNGIEVIYWDNTSAKRKYRRDLVEAGKKAGYKTVAVWFNVPFELCLERNNNRERVVPESVLRAMYNSIGGGPDYEEGWDEIMEIKYGFEQR